MVMTKSKMANRYAPEVRARAVRTVFEHQGSSETRAGAIAASAPRDRLYSPGFARIGQAGREGQRHAPLSSLQAAIVGQWTA